MSRWTEQLSNHQIWETLQQIKEHLSFNFDTTDEEEFAEKRRLEQIISHYEEVLNRLNAERVPLVLIDEINNDLANHIMRNTQAFSTSGDFQNLRAANEYISNRMQELDTLQSFSRDIAPDSQIRKLNELADEFERSVSKKRSALETELDSLKIELVHHKDQQQQLSYTIAAKNNEINTLTSSWQEQFSQAQEQKLNEFNSFRSQLEIEAKKNTEKLIEKTEDSAKILIDETTKDLEKLLSDSDKKHKEILDLYGLVAGDSVAAGYTKNADLERKQANLWRWFTIGFITTTAAWLLAVVGYTTFSEAKEFEWMQYLLMFPLTGVLLFGAAYSAQQSTKHRNSEKRDRWFALRVKAIDPFISSLDDDQQKELKKELSSQLFGDKHEDDRAGVINEHAIVTLTKLTTDILKASK